MLTIAMAVLTCQVLIFPAGIVSLVEFSPKLLDLCRTLVLQAVEILRQNGSFLQG